MNSQVIFFFFLIKNYRHLITLEWENIYIANSKMGSFRWYYFRLSRRILLLINQTRLTSPLRLSFFLLFIYIYIYLDKYIYLVRRFGVESIHYTVNTLVKEKVKPKPERKWRAALCLLGYTPTPLHTTFFSALLAAPLSFFLLFAPNKNSSLPTIFLSRYQRNRFPFFGVCR